MTRQEIDAVLDRVRTWPENKQEDAAVLLLEMERDDAGFYVLLDEERADLLEGLAEAERGKFASPENIEAILSRHR